jgi:hypothetical protein
MQEAIEKTIFIINCAYILTDNMRYIYYKGQNYILVFQKSNNFRLKRSSALQALKLSAIASEKMG